MKDLKISAVRSSFFEVKNKKGSYVYTVLHSPPFTSITKGFDPRCCLAVLGTDLLQVYFLVVFVCEAAENASYNTRSYYLLTMATTSAIGVDQIRLNDPARTVAIFAVKGRNFSDTEITEALVHNPHIKTIKIEYPRGSCPLLFGHLAVRENLETVCVWSTPLWELQTMWNGVRSLLEPMQRNNATRKVKFHSMRISPSTMAWFLDGATHLLEVELHNHVPAWKRRRRRPCNPRGCPPTTPQFEEPQCSLH